MSTAQEHGYVGTHVLGSYTTVEAVLCSLTVKKETPAHSGGEQMVAKRAMELDDVTVALNR